MTPNCLTYSKHLTYILIVLRPSWPWSYGSWIYNYLCNQCLSPLMLWVRFSIRARCTSLCDKVYQWLVTDRWFSPGPPVSSINKTDRHDKTEILLKVQYVCLFLTQQSTNPKRIVVSYKNLDVFLVRATRFWNPLYQLRWK
jgi:hypothetical protein